MSLSTTIKSIQDIMRKDVGVDGDAQRIGQLVWILFLKIWDDREQELELLEDRFASPLVGVTWVDASGEAQVAPDLRWRTWAADPEGVTGDKLLSFTNDVLFPALKGMLPGPRTDDPAAAALRARRALVKSVFEDAYQYMKSGTLLRQVLNKVQEAVDFNDSKSRHVFGDIYEQVLHDLQGAGQRGRVLHAPRRHPVRRRHGEPDLGEVILDPACGTGGFLACAIEHVRAAAVKTPEQEARLQASIRGVEKKPLPHLLAVTNMIVHGIDVPTGVRHDNTLARPAARPHRQGPRGRHPHQPALRRHGGGRRRGQLPGRLPHPGDGRSVPGPHRRAAQARRPGRRGPPRRHAVRRGREDPGQGAPALRVRPAHHRPPAKGGVRALHQHPDQRAVLHQGPPHPRGLVLRAPLPARREVLLQDQAHAASRSSTPRRRGGPTAKRPPSAWRVPIDDSAPAATTSTSRTPTRPS
jgi:hypothetical protein